MSKIRLAYVALGVSFAVSAFAQVPTIIKEIGELESVRDPKCYATASRLEDFIYGTPLESEARFEKIALQKAFIRASGRRRRHAAAGQTEISVDVLRPCCRPRFRMRRTRTARSACATPRSPRATGASTAASRTHCARFSACSRMRSMRRHRTLVPLERGSRRAVQGIDRPHHARRAATRRSRCAESESRSHRRAR